MRISDWSSDVCSSYLRQGDADDTAHLAGAVIGRRHLFLEPGGNLALKSVEPALGFGDRVGLHRHQAVDLGHRQGARPVRFLGRCRSEEHTSELEALVRNSYGAFGSTKHIE